MSKTGSKHPGSGSTRLTVHSVQRSPGKRSRVHSRYGAQPAAVQTKPTVQRVGADDPGRVHEVADAGIAGSGSMLPFLDQIQPAFGSHDVTGVRAHTDGAAVSSSAELGAAAYAKGNDIAFGGAPDLHTAAHEAAHVVQQRAGVQIQGGVGQAGDAYERHADAVADRVVRGESESAKDESAKDEMDFTSQPAERPVPSLRPRAETRLDRRRYHPLAAPSLHQAQVCD